MRDLQADLGLRMLHHAVQRLGGLSDNPRFILGFGARMDWALLCASFKRRRHPHFA